MKVVKILERKQVIQFFGWALLISPIFNTIASMAVLPNSPHKWTFRLFWRMIVAGAPADQVLYVAGILIGLVMVRGSVSAWRYALILLGCHIAHQLWNFSENMKSSWLYAFFFASNVILFLFIADQLVWKQRPAKAPSTAVPSANKDERPLEAKRRKKLVIDFEGLGPWAQLVSISAKGVHLRGLGPTPPGIESRIAEIALQENLILRVRLTRQTDQDYFFEYLRLSSQDIHHLNQWIQQQAA